MGNHPLDGVVSLAGVGRPENRSHAAAAQYSGIGFQVGPVQGCCLAGLIGPGGIPCISFAAIARQDVPGGDTGDR